MTRSRGCSRPTILSPGRSLTLTTLDGNLLQKTSPAPNQTGTATQTVSYCYDELHRVTGEGLRRAKLSAGYAGCHLRL